jgi:hypothetical protein
LVNTTNALLKLKAMKSRIIILGIIILTAAMILSGYMISNEKVKNYNIRIDSARINLASAKQSLTKSQFDATQSIKTEYDDAFIANANRITELRSVIVNKNSADKNINLIKLSQLEKTNLQMSILLNNYMEEGQVKWASFNMEYKRDMEILRISLRDFNIHFIDE